MEDSIRGGAMTKDRKDLNSDDRRERTKALATFVRSPKGTAEYAREQARMNRLWKNPKARAHLKEMHQKTVATIKAQQDSGAGYPSDVALRELQMEYNHRLMKFGVSYLPASHNIAEAFFARREEFAGFFLLPEEDYLVSYTDFLDFVTSTDAPPLEIGAAAALSQNRIVNVNSLDDPGSLLLDTDEGHSFSILGASYVRRGDEVSMLIVVGERLPDDELHMLEVSSHAPQKIAPHKPELPKPDSQGAEIRYVDAERQLVRGFALCRFNLKEKRLEARCLLRDHGNQYSVLTDIAEAVQHSSDPNKSLRNMGEKLSKVSVVWEVGKMLLLLPAYLNAKVSLQRTETRTTRLGLQLQNSLKAKRVVEKAAPDAKVIFRRISAVRIERPSSPQQIVGRSYTPPMFQVPVAGFWRVFADHGQIGHDEKGVQVLGKTWVHGHVRHKDKSEGPGPKVVYIKSSLAQARRKLEQYRERVASSEGAKGAKRKAVSLPKDSAPVGEGPVGAYVYVLRCPAHGRDIYKVGYTDKDPEHRARELSHATGAPTPFLVVQAWAVSHGREAEAAAHQALDSFRLDSSREFFQATYAALRRALEGAIQPWAL